MSLSKAYDELTDNPTFTDGLQVATGHAIKDGGGTERLHIPNTGTSLKDESGIPRVTAVSGGRVGFSAGSGEKITFKDADGNFFALRYLPSSSAPGTLELPNAEFVADNLARFSGTATYNGVSNTAIGFSGISTTESQRFTMRNYNDNEVAMYNDSGELIVQDSAGNTTILT